MSSAPQTNWYEANQAHLASALAHVRSQLEDFLAGVDAHVQREKVSPAEAGVAAATGWPFPQPPALEQLCSIFELSEFERKVLLMCAGAELDSRFSALFGALHKDAQRTQPTFSLALSLFPDAHWSALTPARPLRQWQLVQLSSGESLSTAPIRIQERVLHFLAGVHSMDERLQPLVHPLAESGPLPASQLSIAQQIAAAWSHAESQTGLPIVQLCGNADAGKRNVAAAACAMAGLRSYAIAGWTLPQLAADAELLRRLWEREAVLTSSALLLECDEDTQETSSPAISWLMESIRSPLIVSTRAPRKCGSRSALLCDVINPTAEEQTQVWRDALQSSLSQVNGRLESLVSQFNLGSSAIHAAVVQAGSQVQESDLSQQPNEGGLAGRLWDACRIQARPRLENLAQRLEPVAGWEDLVLPENQKQVLRQIAVHVRQRAKVYRSWGFASRSSRGLGISALFAGPSGTGKTMAAEVLANELRLDLYRIDLSQVVSKYIGETEKNLRRVFDAAEQGAAVLLFDEADALFGKRSEVKDSHDRYANIEVSYLLQRMEAYRGLAILTTNRKSALDQAFMRRIRFVIEFPFPDVAQRVEIWRRVFPQATPTDDLKMDRLARLHVAGGHIHNIALAAAFLAADAGEPVRMSHLLHSARSEFAKMEKPLPDAEVAGWV